MYGSIYFFLKITTVKHELVLKSKSCAAKMDNMIENKIIHNGKINK